MITSIGDKLLIITINNELVKISLKMPIIDDGIRIIRNPDKIWKNCFTICDKSEILVCDIQSIGQELFVVYENGDIYVWDVDLTNKKRIAQIPNITRNNSIIKSIIRLHSVYVYGLCVTSESELYIWKSSTSSVTCDKINLGIAHVKIVNFDVIGGGDNVDVIIYYESHDKLHTILFNTTDRTYSCDSNFTGVAPTHTHKNKLDIVTELSIYTCEEVDFMTYGLTVDGGVYMWYDKNGWNNKNTPFKNNIHNLDKKILSQISTSTLNAALKTKTKFKSQSILYNIKPLIFPHQPVIIESIHAIKKGIIMISKNKVTSYFINNENYIFENLPVNTPYPKEIIFFANDPIIYVNQCTTLLGYVYCTYVVTYSGSIYLWVYHYAYHNLIIKMYTHPTMVDINPEFNRKIKSAKIL